MNIAAETMLKGSGKRLFILVSQYVGPPSNCKTPSPFKVSITSLCIDAKMGENLAKNLNIVAITLTLSNAYGLIFSISFWRKSSVNLGLTLPFL